MQNPLNWSVAPNIESIRLPQSPAIVAIGTTSSSLRATSVPHETESQPTITKVNPISKPAAAAARRPSTETAPLVPFRTF